VRLGEANRQLAAMATTDGLTGIPNRRCFNDLIRREWDRMARAGTGLSVRMIDVDRFKSYNDVLGHLAGDACLCQVAKSLAAALRPSDHIARYGGEEFTVIIVDVDAVETINIARRLLAAVEEMARPSPAGGPVTVSIGAAVCHPTIDSASVDDEGVTPRIHALIAEADANLYEAKRAGRNCVRTSQAERPKPVRLISRNVCFPQAHGSEGSASQG
jgi:diguanylate cyclase (GGDEF)-like protein